MFTIYHIPGVKVGCTNRSPEIRVKEQGYFQFEILEVLGDLSTASERELYWQIKLGYKKDNIQYLTTLKMQPLGTIASNKPEAKLKKITSIKNSKKFKLARREPRRGKVILQFDKFGCFIAEWNKIKDAAKAYNCSGEVISTCCRGRQKTAAGFIWKYKTNQ